MVVKKLYRKDAIASSRSAFTLIELMVVVGIMVLLAVMTVAAINLTVNGDKVRAAGRQVQSFLSGARDRAIYAKEPRGVRFLVDPTNPRTVSSMAYIRQPAPWNIGAVQIQFGAGPGTTIIANTVARVDSGLDWQDLYNLGLLRDGAQITIEGNTYNVSNTANVFNSPPSMKLTVTYLSPATNPSVVIGNPAILNQPPLGYSLQLPPSLLPNQDPILLPKGTVVDLDRCNKIPAALPASLNTGSATLPSSWFDSSTTPIGYSSQMDVMFSPRGTVIGSSASRGVIHFYVGVQTDADKGLLPEDPTGGDKVVVSLFGRTGVVSVHPVDLIDTTTVTGTYDYFKYAETGEVAGK
ncbi:MAG: hypothetical protein JWP89_890 [Schlesneria sp.]|nr:hypothetical protein [Schlesneria sp.]